MQVLRINKLDLFPIICRLYGTRRPNHNYYEILEVSPDCSQKEIRRAFLALSKQCHPDIIGDKGHDKFVKLQEAYNILSKEETRRQYDMKIKYHVHSSYSSPYVRQNHPYQSEHIYRSRREWEEHMARGTWQPQSFHNKNHKYNKTHFIVLYTVFGLVLLACHFALLHFRILRTKNVQENYQREYNLLRKNIQGLSFEEQHKIVQDRIKATRKEKEEIKEDLK